MSCGCDSISWVTKGRHEFNPVIPLSTYQSRCLQGRSSNSGRRAKKRGKNIGSEGIETKVLLFSFLSSLLALRIRRDVTSRRDGSDPSDDDK